MFRNFKQTGVTNPLKYAIKIGFFAGLIWGALRLLSFYLNFTTEPAGFLLKMWQSDAYIYSWKGDVLGTITFIVMSILASLLYMWWFREQRGPWPGVWYGLGFWGLLFGLGPTLGFLPIKTGVKIELALTDLCFFIVWGLFIGYSIAFEFTDESSREAANAF